MNVDGPLLSIVIANYNYGRFLGEAIESIISQGVGREVEILVCDAASTDNSIEIIRRYERHIAWWCSEKDGGQSDAFNKGFSHARGKYLTWLNADDILCPGCLEKVILAFRRHPECEWFTGNFFWFTQDGCVTEIGWGPHFYPQIAQTPHSPLVIFGPTSFFSKRIFNQVGGMDVSMHYIMDNDLWYRFITAGVKQRRVRTFCWGFRMHECSKTAEYGDRVLSEKVKRAMRAEKRRALEKSGYVMSRVSRYVLLVMRIFDGSILCRQYFKLAFKKVGAR